MRYWWALCIHTVLAFSAAAEPESVFGACDDAQFGLTNDGAFVYRLSQPAYSDIGNLSVYDLKREERRQTQLAGLPIGSKALAGPMPKSDNRIDPSSLHFSGPDQTLRIFSLSEMQVSAEFSSAIAEGAGGTGLLARGSYGSSSRSIRMKQLIAIPSPAADIYEYFVNLRNGSVEPIFNRETGTFVASTTFGRFIISAGQNRTCMIASKIWKPLCFEGEFVELAETPKGAFLTQRIDAEYNGFLLSTGTGGLEVMESQSWRGDLFFDFSSGSLKDETGRSLPNSMRASNSSLLFGRRTDRETVQLMMTDESFSLGLILVSDGSRRSVQVLSLLEASEPLVVCASD